METEQKSIHHCILIGNELTASAPYEFAIRGEDGRKISTTMTCEEYACISSLLARLTPVENGN